MSSAHLKNNQEISLFPSMEISSSCRSILYGLRYESKGYCDSRSLDDNWNINISLCYRMVSHNFECFFSLFTSISLPKNGTNRFSYIYPRVCLWSNSNKKARIQFQKTIFEVKRTSYKIIFLHEINIMMLAHLIKEFMNSSNIRWMNFNKDLSWQRIRHRI